ncbi:MAG: hypothetical protein M3Q65_19005 [Chloroflexota bacterium]|nr:hypothetical protein [Chloroflexota bacterium]
MRRWGRRVTMMGALLASLATLGVTGLARAAPSQGTATPTPRARCATAPEIDPGFQARLPAPAAIDPGFLLRLPDIDRIDPGFRSSGPCRRSR